MADHVQTVTNSLNLFGGGPSTKWGANAAATYTMTWGTSKWGEGTEDIRQDVEHGPITGTITLSEPTLAFSVTKLLSETMTLSSDSSDQGLQSGSWNYIFPSNQTDADNQLVPSWAAGTAGSSSWTSGTVGTTTWT